MGAAWLSHGVRDSMVLEHKVPQHAAVDLSPLVDLGEKLVGFGDKLGDKLLRATLGSACILGYARCISSCQHHFLLNKDSGLSRLHCATVG